MKIRQLILLAVITAVLGGCGYSKMYGQYAALQAEACGQERQPVVQFVDSGGQPVTVYERRDKCVIQPPDNPGRIAADVAISAGKTAIGIKGLDELGGVMKRGYDRAGDQAGGDGVFGSNNQDVFTDKTAPPPEPVIVEPPSGDGD